MRIMSAPRAVLAMVAVLVLIVSACAPAAPSPTPAPAKPAATTAPAQPTAAAKPADASKPKEKLRVSIPIITYGLSAPYYVGRENGYFADEGIDIELINMAGTAASAALLAGGIEISTSSGTAMNAILQGAPLKVVAALSERSPYLVYTTNPAVKSLKDLEGKTFGVQDRGDTHHEAALIGLRQAGVDPKKVTFVAVGAGAGRLQALAGHSVDAVNLIDSELDQLKQQNIQATQIADLRKTVRAHNGGVATTDTMIKDRRDVVVRFFRALRKGILFTQKNPDKATDAWVNAKEIAATKTPREGLRASIQDFYVDSDIPTNASHTPEVQQALLEVKKELIPDLKALPAPEKVFDFSLVQQGFKDVADSGWKP